jgi:hypothetical protein
MVDAHYAERPREILRAGKIATLPRSKHPRINLRYGQVMWLLTELGYSNGVQRATLHEYLKGLRKLGIPFGHRKFQTEEGGRRIAEYSYCHLMELAIVFSLRVYHIVPDSVIRGIIRYRSQLHRFYRQAYAQRRTGAGSPLVVEVRNHAPIELHGLFLDLRIKFSAGRLVRFGPPKMLSSVEALALFSKGISGGRALQLRNLSLLSEQLAALAIAASQTRSGPPSRSKSKKQR